MQSPLLHQLSSLRNSHTMHDDPMNYHPSTSSSTHPRFALRPRALQSAAALPLSSLAPSGSGDNILAATLLDISSASSMSASSSGDQAQQPQSKSEQDLARYLATSNPTPQAQGDASLSREQTLLHRDSEWGPHANSLGGGMFNSSGSGGLMAMSLSWGDIHGANTTVTPSTNTVPIPSPILIDPAATRTSGSQPQSSASSAPPNSESSPAASASASSPQEPSTKPYTPMPTYFPAPLPAVPESRPGSDYSHSHSPGPHSPGASGAGNAPLSLPMPSPLPRVNVNTGPRVPISPHMRPGSVHLASPHLHPANLHGTVSPASVYAELHPPHAHPAQLASPHPHPPAAHSPHMHPAAAAALSRPGSVLSQSQYAVRAPSPHGSSPFPDDLELAYPASDFDADGGDADGAGDAVRYVNLADLQGSSSFSTTLGRKRSASPHAGAAAGAKRVRLEAGPAEESGGEDDDGSGSSGSGSGSEEGESEDDDSDFDVDDSGEFVPGRRGSAGFARSRPARGRPVKKEGDEAAGGEVRVSSQHKQKQANGKGRAQPKQKSSGSGEKAKAKRERRKVRGERAKRRKHTGSAAEALRVVTELAKASSVVPAPAASASEAQQAPQDKLEAEDEGEMNLVKSEGDAAARYFGDGGGAGEGGLPIARAAYESPQGQARSGYPAASSTYTPSYAGYSSTSTPGPGPSYASMAPYTPLHPTSAYTNTTANGTPGSGGVAPYYDDALRARKNSVIPLPVPVPNLIKKSRGRHVPAVALPAANAFSPTPVPSSSAGASSSSGSGLGRTGSAGSVGGGGGAGAERAFVCAVEGCGKCFVRGEHLKRHVRSIHTHDKPYRCPHDGCGKAFSRRDNLAQHTRVHLPA